MSSQEQVARGRVEALEDPPAPFEAPRFPGLPDRPVGGSPIAGWIFYDAACALCAGSAKRTARSLGRHGFELVPLQTPGTAERVGVTEAALFARVHLLTREGRRFAGADALVEVARHIGWARPLAFMAGLPRVLPRLRRIYDWVAANRYCFGGTCPLPRRRSWPDWLPLLVLPALALALRGFMADWIFMWAMAIAIFAGCKWLTYRKAVARGVKLSGNRAPGYLFGWVGMEAEAFAKTMTVRTPPTSAWLHALGRILVGATLVWGVARMPLPVAPLLSGWIAMFGFILLLHFGTFQGLALVWQRAGVPVEPLMRAPLRATSLGDFWGQRWNTGFHAVAHTFLFRPLSRLLGSVDRPETPTSKIQTPNKHQTPNTKRGLDAFAHLQNANKSVRCAEVHGAHWSFLGSWTLVFGSLPWVLGVKGLFARALPVLGVFLVSGLVHEIVITLPARGGYGLPTAYFLLQGLGLVFERSAFGRRLGLGAGLRGRLFAIVVAAAPAFWLFPPIFVRNIILPMLEAIGAL
jgi:predicted DCC family thiol-disulfide oxidoreductase YuxK